MLSFYEAMIILLFKKSEQGRYCQLASHFFILLNLNKNSDKKIEFGFRVYLLFLNCVVWQQFLSIGLNFNTDCLLANDVLMVLLEILFVYSQERDGDSCPLHTLLYSFYRSSFESSEGNANIERLSFDAFKNGSKLTACADNMTLFLKDERSIKSFKCYSIFPCCLQF